MKRDTDFVKKEDKLKNYLEDIKVEFSRTNYVIESVKKGQEVGRKD